VFLGGIGARSGGGGQDSGEVPGCLKGVDFLTDLYTEKNFGPRRQVLRNAASGRSTIAVAHVVVPIGAPQSI
jgi:hypothetical protein